MTKKNILIVIVLLLILAAGFTSYYFYFFGSSRETGGEVVTPFPDTKTPDQAGQTPGGGETTPPPPEKAPILKHVSDKAIIGARIMNGDRIRIIERGTGYVFDVTSREEIKTTNKTIPFASAALMLSDNHFIIQYPKEAEGVESFIGTIKGVPGTSTEATIEGSFLPQDIEGLVSNPLHTQIFYLIDTENGVEGIVADTTGNKKVRIFSSKLREWRAEWPSANLITLTSKAAAGAPGILYTLSPKSGARSVALIHANGLTTRTSHNGTLVMVSQTDNSFLVIKNLEKGTEKNLNISTLPEKCVWSTKSVDTFYCAVPQNPPRASYPDAWYKGEVSFTDLLYKVNATTGIASKIAESEFVGKNFDMTKLFLDTAENHLYFINKKDSTLWSVDLLQK